MCTISVRLCADGMVLLDTETLTRGETHQSYILEYVRGNKAQRGSVTSSGSHSKEVTESELVLSAPFGMLSTTLALPRAQGHQNHLSPHVLIGDVRILGRLCDQGNHSLLARSPLCLLLSTEEYQRPACMSELGLCPLASRLPFLAPLVRTDPIHQSQQ